MRTTTMLLLLLLIVGLVFVMAQNDTEDEGWAPWWAWWTAFGKDRRTMTKTEYKWAQFYDALASFFVVILIPVWIFHDIARFA